MIRDLAGFSTNLFAEEGRRRRSRIAFGRPCHLLTPVTPVGGGVGLQGAAQVPVGQWEGNWEGRMAETTQTDGAGATFYRVFVVDPEWSFSLFFDATDAAIAAGFTIGAVITVNFLLGGGGTCDKLTNTTVGGVRRILDAKGETPIGVTIHGKGGALTLNVAP